MPDHARALRKLRSRIASSACTIAFASLGTLAQNPAPFTIDTVFSVATSTVNNALLTRPYGVAVDTSGNLYVSDVPGNRILKRSPSGAVTVLAGTGTMGFSGDGGPATAAMLASPYGVGVDSAGNVFFADSGNNRIRRISKDGIITTLAGGPGSDLGFLQNIAVDPAGNVYVPVFSRVVQVDPSGVEKTVAGGGPLGLVDGQLATAGSFVGVQSVAVDATGNLFVATVDGIYKVLPDGRIFSVPNSSGVYGSSAMAANASRGVCYSMSYQIHCLPGFLTTVVAGTGVPGLSGDGGPALVANLNGVAGLAFDSSGNLYLADSQNARVRVIAPNGIITSIMKGTLPIQVRFPKAVAAHRSGALYVSDEAVDAVWRRAPDGTVTVFAGTGVGGTGGEGEPSNESPLRGPIAVAVDGPGNVYISEIGNHRVRVVDSNGIVRTLAGNGIEGFGGDGGPAKNAMLHTPAGVAVDTAGNVYIADMYNNRIRRVAPNGIITTVAGSGPMRGVNTSVAGGDGGLATGAQINNPQYVAVNAAGDVFLGDGNRIRRFRPGGTVTTVAGNGSCNVAGDGGPATAAGLCGAFGMAFDSVAVSISPTRGVNAFAASMRPE